MNNGTGNNAHNPRVSNATTRNSKRPASDIKLGTNDSEPNLVRANVTAVINREVAFDHTAKTGLFSRAGAADVETLAARFNLSVMYTAKWVQTHLSKEQVPQDALWTLKFINDHIQEQWRAKVGALQTDLDKAHEEIQRLKDINAWANDATANANDIAAAIMTRIAPVIEQKIAAHTAAGSPDAAKLDALHQRFSMLDNTVKVIGTAVENVNTLLTTRPMYAAAAATAPPSSVPSHYAGRPHLEQDALARSELKVRRLLITADTDRQNKWLDNKPFEPIAKAAQAIEKTIETIPLPPSLPDLKAATPLHAFRVGKSGVVYSFNSKDVVDWITSPDVWPTFATHFEPGVKKRPRLFEVLLRNLPFSYDPGADGFLPALLEANSLPEGSIDNARWMKPAARRSNSQRSAHLLLSFRSVELANEVLDRGTLALESCVYRVERLLRDPARCAKCQRHGHFAEKCPNTYICGRCAGEGHHSNDCSDTGTPNCATCSLTPNSDSKHPAWARDCPARLRALDRLQRTFLEDFAPRFLTGSNVDLVLPRFTQPLADVSLHRAPPGASGAKKHNKSTGKQKAGANTGAGSAGGSSRPATPSGPAANKRSQRPRAPSAASTSSAASNGTRKAAQRRSRASSSSQAVEDQLNAVTDADSTQ